MKTKDEQIPSQAELVRLALKLKEDLFALAETSTSSMELTGVMESAGALILAITDPRELPVHPLPSKKTAQMFSFPRRRGVTPSTLH